jgi:hypothetical protein
MQLSSVVVVILASVSTIVHAGAAFVKLDDIVQGPSLADAFHTLPHFTDIRWQLRPLRQIRDTLTKVKQGRVPRAVASLNNNGVSDRVKNVYRVIFKSNILTAGRSTLAILHSPEWKQVMKIRFQQIPSSLNFPRKLCFTTQDEIINDLVAWYINAVQRYKWRAPVEVSDYATSIFDLKEFNSNLNKIRNFLYQSGKTEPQGDVYYTHQIMNCVHQLEAQFREYFGALSNELFIYIRKQNNCKGVNLAGQQYGSTTPLIKIN